MGDLRKLWSKEDNDLRILDQIDMAVQTAKLELGRAMSGLQCSYECGIAEYSERERGSSFGDGETSEEVEQKGSEGRV